MEGLSFKPTTAATAAGDRRTRPAAPAAPRDDDGGGAAAAAPATTAVIPLSRRPVPLRLDVLPFLLVYPALAACDLYLSSSSEDGGGGVSAVRLAVAVDLLFLSALLGQLALWLACQWDPRRRAAVAFSRRDEDGRGGMEGWTHALVVPAGQQRAEDGGGGGGSEKRRRKRSSAVGGERPGIVPLDVETVRSGRTGDGPSTAVATVRFRGWTYRCCRAGGRRGGYCPDDDPPMESIWRRDGDSVGEIDDGDEINGRDGESGDSDPCRPPSFHRPRHPVDLPLAFYSGWSGHTSRTLSAASSVYGNNETDVPLPPYLSLLGEQLLQPLFLFQVLCVVLWSLDEYWMYAQFTLLSLVAFEGIQAMNRWKSVKRLREEVGGGDGRLGGVDCYRDGRWTSVRPSGLVAGDVVAVSSPSSSSRGRIGGGGSAVRGLHDHGRGSTLPADLLLLGGRAVVNEAMLTGESVPQVKEAVVGEEEEGGTATARLDLSDGSAHRRGVLFGGTVLVDHHADGEDGGGGEGGPAGSASSYIPPPPNGGLVCFVLRTGFDTVQGSLLRDLAHRAEGGGSNSAGGEGVNSSDTFAFLLLLLLIALLSAGTVLRGAWGDVTRNHFRLVLHVTIIITAVIPPELPMELSLAVTQGLGELVRRYQVYCTEPFRIPLAGLVDTCCFDKTGTLTSDELRLHGVRLPSVETVEGGGGDGDLVLFDSPEGDGGRDGAPSRRPALPAETLRVMVGCQSLAVTHAFAPGPDGRASVRRELCGDPLEKAVVEGCGYTIDPGSGAVGPAEDAVGGGGGTAFPGVRVLHRFAFSSKLRRMTVVAADRRAGGEDAGGSPSPPRLWALTKGAPEAVLPLLGPSAVPADYESSFRTQMSLGRRVLALAYRDLGPADAAGGWNKPSRDGVERDLTFAGLLVMDRLVVALSFCFSSFLVSHQSDNIITSNQTTSAPSSPTRKRSSRTSRRAGRTSSWSRATPC